MTDITLTVEDNGRFAIIQDAIAHRGEFIDRVVRQSVTDDIEPAILPEAQAEPGPVKTPIQWTSAKQRRFVRMQQRKGIIPAPYVRTHALSRGWKFKVETTPGATTISLGNDAPHYRFVEGENQQGWHGVAGTGWFSAPDKAEGWTDTTVEKTMDALEVAWGGL